MCAGIFALNLLFLLNRRVAPRDFSVVHIESGASEITAYIATYLLPFLVVSDVGWRDLIAYAVLVITIGIVMTRDSILHINPLLALFQYRLITITTGDGVNYYLLTPRHVRPGETVRAFPIRARLLMER